MLVQGNNRQNIPQRILTPAQTAVANQPGCRMVMPTSAAPSPGKTAAAVTRPANTQWSAASRTDLVTERCAGKGLYSGQHPTGSSRNWTSFPTPSPSTPPLLTVPAQHPQPTDNPSRRGTTDAHPHCLQTEQRKMPALPGLQDHQDPMEPWLLRGAWMSWVWILRKCRFSPRGQRPCSQQAGYSPASTTPLQPCYVR